MSHLLLHEELLGEQLLLQLLLLHRLQRLVLHAPGRMGVSALCSAGPCLHACMPAGKRAVHMHASASTVHACVNYMRTCCTCSALLKLLFFSRSRRRLGLQATGHTCQAGAPQIPERGSWTGYVRLMRLLQSATIMSTCIASFSWHSHTCGPCCGPWSYACGFCAPWKGSCSSTAALSSSSCLWTARWTSPWTFPAP